MHQKRNFWKGVTLSGHACTHASELRKLQNGFACTKTDIARAQQCSSALLDLYTTLVFFRVLACWSEAAHSLNTAGVV